MGKFFIWGFVFFDFFGGEVYFFGVGNFFFGLLVIGFFGLFKTPFAWIFNTFCPFNLFFLNFKIFKIFLNPMGGAHFGPTGKIRRFGLGIGDKLFKTCGNQFLGLGGKQVRGAKKQFFLKSF